MHRVIGSDGIMWTRDISSSRQKYTPSSLISELKETFRGQVKGTTNGHEYTALLRDFVAGDHAACSMELLVHVGNHANCWHWHSDNNPLSIKHTLRFEHSGCLSEKGIKSDFCGRR